MTMAEFQKFESMLKDVVNAKRLSASKMNTLTEIALKNMQNDTQLVSILYRTHKSLPPPAKIHSLYAFDALSRAARNQVNKQKLAGDVHQEQGNCATFLMKVDGVLDGLFHDMVTLGHPDAKEKTKKILDIWTKSNTFPSAVLARLTELLKGSLRKDPETVSSSTVTRDPRQQHSTPPAATTTPPTTTTPPQPPAPATFSSPVVATPESVQSTLLALLSQAANAVGATNGQTPTNIAPVPAQLDASQLALFQQLTQTAKAAGNVPVPPVHLPLSLVPSATANAVPPVALPHGGPSQPLPYRDDHFGSGRRDPKYDRYDGYDRGRNRDDYNDDRRDFRGDLRGGPPRGGGFRGRGRGRWDDRERHPPRNRERDWNPSRRRPSRSRSPGSPRVGRPGGGPGRRDDRHNPPNQPISTYMSDVPPDAPNHTPVAGPTKDEFGRDLRSQSPTANSTPPHSAPVQDVLLKSPLNGTASIASAVVDTYEKLPVSVEQLVQTTPVTPLFSTPSNSSSSAAPTVQPSASGGLTAVDLSSFDPTNPSSWEALGKAWAEANGSLPSQEELMQYVMAGMSGGSMGGYDQYSGIQQQGGQGDWSGQSQSWGYPGRGRGKGRGRGGYGYGNDRGGGQWGYPGGRGSYEDTDAITLGGGEDDSPTHSAGAVSSDASWQVSHDPPAAYNEQGASHDSLQSPSEGASRAGKMQRIGDKWVFVRADTTAQPAAEVA